MINLRVLFVLALCALMARPVPTQAEPVDSLMVEEIHPPFDIENRELRLLAKVAAGTASSVVFTAIALGGLGEVLIDDSYSDDGLEAVGLLFVSSYVGTMVGFPLGVSKVDPHDSLRKTLLGSGVTVLGGIVLRSRLKTLCCSLI